MSVESNVTPQREKWRLWFVRARRLLEAFGQSQHFTSICLVLILLLGAAFRLTGVNWDNSLHFHPDERHIWMVAISLSLPKSLGEYFNTAVSPLNPYNRGSSFVYGTLPLFLTKWLGEVLRVGGDRIHILGRVLAASFDLVTVFLMFLIGRKLYNARVGLLAAFLSACLVINIQQAHFFTMDSFAAMFVALTFYFALWVADRGSWRDFIGMGISYGLAVACRINVAIIAIVIGLAVLWRLYQLYLYQPPVVVVQPPVKVPGRRQWEWKFGGVRIALKVNSHANEYSEHSEPIVSAPAQHSERTWLDAIYPVAIKTLVCAVCAFVAFRIAQPYTFQGPGFFGLKLSENWLRDMRNWSPILSGKADSYPSHQWAARPPVLYTMTNMVLWLVGVPMGLASGAGWGLAWYELLRKRVLQHLLLLAWTTFSFFYHSTQFIKNPRYLIPFYPFMALMAAYLLIYIWDRARSVQFRWAKPAAIAVVCFVTVGTFLWAFAFTRIYARPHTWVTASRWIYENIPKGSAITGEAWGDWLPWGGVDGRNGFADGTYTGIEMHPYAEDSPEKLGWFMDWLNQADYIILSSNRLYASIPRLPMRYPMTTRYYKCLFSGELGFELIKTITSRPNLGPIEFRDDEADESFTVYDHPKVLIFKKTADYSSEKAYRLLSEGIDWQNIARLLPIQVADWKNGLQMTEEEKEVQRNGGTWSKIFNRNSLSNALPVFFWLLLVEVLGVITSPFADVIFHNLADRGYILAKSLGILLLTWITWILVNVGLTGFSRTAIGVALLLLTGSSALIFWRRREEMLAFWKDKINRRLIWINEGLFLLFFLVFLFIRYGNPDLWHPIMGGEKPMDFAYLNAVIKSSIFPPYDPWFAGGYLNYYYFGQIILATLIKFTGIVPWVAYNLAIPLLAALTAMGAFCVVYNLTVTKPKGARSAGSRESSRPRFGHWSFVIDEWWQPALLWGFLAALFVAVLGNLAEIGVPLKALHDMGTTTVKTSIPYLTDLLRVLSGLSRVFSGQARLGIRSEWPYWNPSRVMPNGEINEFPFFTFLYADLHAHLIALPFTLLALGLAVAVIRQKARKRAAGRARFTSLPKDIEELAQRTWLVLTHRVDWEEMLLLSAMGLVVGALRPINSWDYPTYLLVVCIALALREYELRGRIDLQGLWAVAWRAGMVVFLSYVFFWPFLSRFATAYVSFERWKGPRTGLGAYLVIHGLFLWATMSWMGVELFGREVRQGTARMLRLALRYWDRLPRVFALYQRLVRKGREFDTLGWAVIVPMALLIAWLVKSREWFYILVLLLILGTLMIVLRLRMEPKRRFVWLLFGIGLALSLGVDLVVLRGDIGRMNTVFKFYLQVWVLWSVAAAVSLSYLAERLRAWHPDRCRLWWAVFAFLFFLASLYPIFATKAKINDRFDTQVGPTLDGMAYMKRAVYNDGGQLVELKWDYEAINWLLDHVQGSPVIAEANTEPRGLYRWGSRVAIYTGLPTIIGWSWHQRQQRSAMPGTWIDTRLNDVQRLYSDPDPGVALEIVRKYEVRYIYLGEVERIYYPGPGLDKFERMRADGLLDLVYHNEQVRIYEVKQR